MFNIMKLIILFVLVLTGLNPLFSSEETSHVLSKSPEVHKTLENSKETLLLTSSSIQIKNIWISRVYKNLALVSHPLNISYKPLQPGKKKLVICVTKLKSSAPIHLVLCIRSPQAPPSFT